MGLNSQTAKQVMKEWTVENNSTLEHLLQRILGYERDVGELRQEMAVLEAKVLLFDHVWLDLRQIAPMKGMTTDAIRKQLQNGNFEEGVDFKHEGNKIVVHQGAIERIARQRKAR